ncbi:MAG: MerR family transcriptional regulator [Nitrospirae bacterium]|nr:MAG: MerR family transcriptional regulator [Nitrospirota bacterium]
MHDALESPEPLKLFPERIFYKIGEAGKIVGVESYVLRYWETEFPFLKPRKTSSGQRTYTKDDVDLLIQIKKLLHEEKYTIEGVRKKLGSGPLKQQAADAPLDTKITVNKDAGGSSNDEVLKAVRQSLTKLLEDLS